MTHGIMYLVMLTSIALYLSEANILSLSKYFHHGNAKSPLQKTTSHLPHRNTANKFLQTRNTIDEESDFESDFET